MGSPFDGYQKTAYDKVGNTMGDNADWLPSIGGPMQSANVLFNNPTEKTSIDGKAEYDPNHYTMEYRKDFFAGLKPSVDAGGTEQVTIKTVVYNVLNITAKFDGNTLLARIEPT